MNNGLILLITFLIPIFILIIFYILIYRKKKRHAVNIKHDWTNFEKSVNKKHINGIIKYGTELIWNENLTDSNLKEMSIHVDNLIVENQELKDLKNLIYNKKLHWNRDYTGTA